MTKSFDVCIHGDGIVGRTLALLLAQARLKVGLVTHRTAPAVQDIRAYALNSASMQLLQGLRVWPEAQFATPVTTMQVWGDDGGAIDFNAGISGQNALAWIVDVSQLEQQLLQACSFQSLIETVTETVQDPAACKLTVICEGGKSARRRAVGAQWTNKPYHQKAIAARLEASTPHGGAARQWFAGSDVLALLPMGGLEGSSLGLVWSVSDERALQLLSLPADDFCAELTASCRGSVQGLRLTSDRASWPLALGGADRWVGPGWALAGDAAHTVHPLAGQGLNLGLGDAAYLHQVLVGREYWRGLGDEKLLRRYERARKADAASVGAVTDGLQTLFAQTGPGWDTARNWGMNAFAASQPLKNWLTRRAAGPSL